MLSYSKKNISSSMNLIFFRAISTSTTILVMGCVRVSIIHRIIETILILKLHNFLIQRKVLFLYFLLLLFVIQFLDL